MTLQERINAIQSSTEFTDEEKTSKVAELYSEFDKMEQMMKDNQSAFTKAQQDKIDLANKLVADNPANVEKISDEKVRKKILQEKWWVDSLEELKIMFPDFWKVEDEDDDDEKSVIEKLEQKVRLMEHNTTKTKTNEAIDETLNGDYKKVIATIPDFRDKLNSELGNLSSKLNPKERVERAMKLVVGQNVSTANVYAMLQGITLPTSHGEGEWEWGWKIEESPLAQAFKNNIR